MVRQRTALLCVVMLSIAGAGCSKSTEKQAPTGTQDKAATPVKDTPAKPAVHCDPDNPSVNKVDECKQACTAGDMTACAMAGRMLGWGENAPREPEAAHALLAKACEAKNPMGCRLVGAAQLHGVAGFPKDLAAAFTTSKKGCDLGDLSACGNLGESYVKGRGVTKDVKQGMAVLVKACDGGGGRACTNLGNMYFAGDGVAKDPAKAFGYFQKACDQKYAWGCARLADCYTMARGVARDEKQAQALFVKSCDLASGVGCFVAALRYRRGEGAPKDIAKAKALYERACKLGHEKACAARKDMDKPVPKVGACNATSWHAVCGGKCIDTYRNRRHCGGCGQRCPAQTFCAEGRCRDASGGYWSTE